MHDDGYELFRRAVVERDADAWSAIAERYRPLLIAWVGRCEAAVAAGEPFEDLADEGLARAWRALSPERFGGFPNLAALLGYLRTCVTTTVIDAARARAMHERAAQRIRWDAEALPEQVVFQQLGSVELWQLVSGLVATEEEQVVLIERFVFDLPPRVIQDRHPLLYPNVKKIYTAIRNLRERLRRHEGLRRFYAEFLAT
jgi:DNA-directed RNA polymerase specialized sigma24 family protein